MNLDDLRKDYDIVPIARELSADAITPVAAFAALSGDGEAFLFESVDHLPERNRIDAEPFCDVCLGASRLFQDCRQHAPLHRRDVLAFKDFCDHSEANLMKPSCQMGRHPKRGKHR